MTSDLDGTLVIDKHVDILFPLPARQFALTQLITEFDMIEVSTARLLDDEAGYHTMIFGGALHRTAGRHWEPEKAAENHNAAVLAACVAQAGAGIPVLETKVIISGH